jgi:signal transduction histidine kinase
VDELAYASERVRVTRLFVAGRTVIRKQLLGSDAGLRRQHELVILERLRGVEGVAQLVDEPRYPDSLVLADAGSMSLAGLPAPLPVRELIGLATRLARAVAGMHRRGVVHRHITPTNIVLAADGAVHLVDFAAATAAAELPSDGDHAPVVGAVAYLSPEQTGRTGRSVDQRADLYAVGAVLYELATGTPPFGSSDPMALVHDHLARVPTPPEQVNPALPPALSQIVLHLLEKDPDRRYQSAEGLLVDLERLRDGDARPGVGFRVGEHDLPPRLPPPSRLVGRETDVATLHAALDDALTGRCRAVLLAGPPGVGKTALADELRPVVASRNGWFVAGKFDQYRRDLEFDGVAQAFRALGRLLLAEPEDELAAVRGRMLAALGSNAGLATAVIPEFATLLGVPPDAGDPLTAQARAQRNAVQILRAVASLDRPLVVFVDDLQWAGRTPLGLFDLAASEPHMEGLLLVGAYRDTELTAPHPLAGLLERWRGHAAVRQLRLDNLPGPVQPDLLALILQADRDAVRDLARLIEPHTSGNPYETVELLDALRRTGLLTATAHGWRWQDGTLRAYLGEVEPVALSAARIAALPPASRAVVEVMACLGGRAEPGLLEAATGQPAMVVEQALAPALHDGLLVADPDARPTLRFRHDRLRETVLAQMPPSRQRDLQLAMARRLADAPGRFAVAAEQYLPVTGAVDDPTERRRVVGLLRRAADEAGLIGDHHRVTTLLGAALPLIDPVERETLIEVHTDRHAGLVSQGRHEDADEEYARIEALGPTAGQRAEAATAQVKSLTHRNRFAEAIQLSLACLREFGVGAPVADQLAADLGGQFAHLYQWLDHDLDDDLQRREIDDPTLLVATRLLDAVLAAAYLGVEPALHAWLSLEGTRLWLEHGPCRTLLGSLSTAAFHAVVRRGDSVGGYRALRRAVAVGEARGFEPGTSQSRLLFSLVAWRFEPIENGVHAGRRARDGLVAAGELAVACYAFHPSVADLLDCAPSLDAFAVEVEAGLAFARRTGSDQTGQWLDSFRWLAAVLRGELSTTADEAVPTERYAGNPLALFDAHITRGILAAVLGDQDGLPRASAAATSLLPGALGLYTTVWAHVLRSLALAGQARTTHGDQHARLLADMDEQIDWLAKRAVDAPNNFVHLVRWMEAERAWATGDSWAAALAFDAALRGLVDRARPWHEALITERAARFHLGHSLEYTGHALLARARQHYAAWGATAKVAQLDWAHPTLRAEPDTARGLGTDGSGGHVPRDFPTTTATLDLLGILSASQALSSETDLEKLHARAVQVLGALTGATDVHLVLWSDDQREWLLPAPGGGTVPVGRTVREHPVPMSVLRYTQRTGEPLFVADATDDDRFARDAHLADLPCCSLLAMPITRRDRLLGLLLLENHFMRAAFTAEHADTVRLIAGQLAVSLDNAKVYADFRQVADEQTALRRVATLVARGEPPATVLSAVAREVGQLLGADLVVIGRYGEGPSVSAVVGWRRDGRVIPLGQEVRLGGENVMSMVFSSGGPVRIEAYSHASGDVAQWSKAAGVGSAVGVPITVEGRLWGVIMIGLEHERPWPPDTEGRLANFTDLAATAIGNVAAHEQLRKVADEQSALRRVATLVARGVAPEVVFRAVATEVAHVLPAVDQAVIGRYTSRHSVEYVGGWSRVGSPEWVGRTTALGGHNVSTAVFETGQPARVAHLADDTHPTTSIARRSGARSSAGAPINVEGQLWGVMIVASVREADLPRGIERELADFIELLATAIANTQAREELRASRARIVAAADQARRRIERDVHDGAQQRLVSLALQLRAAQASVPPELVELSAELDRTVHTVQDTLEELQEIARGIHPAVLAQGGLRPALKTLARRAPVPVHLDVGVVGRLPDQIEISAYYVAAEALTNAAKHANAAAVTIVVERVDGILRIAVRDDGVGGADFAAGTGLLGLKDRVEAIGGRIRLDSPVGRGTVVTAELPLAGAAAE